MKIYNQHSYTILTSVLDVGEWLNSRPGCFNLGKTVSGNRTTVMDAVEKRKNCPYQEYNRSRPALGRSICRLSYPSLAYNAYIPETIALCTTWRLQHGAPLPTAVLRLVRLATAFSDTCYAEPVLSSVHWGRLATDVTCFRAAVGGAIQCQ
jgi:hypothetical protein